MVNTPTDPSAASERQKVIDWLTSHNYPALPVAPAQPGWKYHKVAPANLKQGIWTHCPLTVVQTPYGTSLQPIPLYTGKNPSYLDKDGLPHLINHRQYQTRLPNQRELDVWFAHVFNGVGTLGGWNNTVWLDIDVKQFPSQQACDAAALKILSSPVQTQHATSLQQTFIERSHSGGWRIGIRVKQKPNFTNFSLTQAGGPHVGEALFEGRFTVLAPTIGPSGNPYQSLTRTLPVEVESLESIGIYSTKGGRRRWGDRGDGGDREIEESFKSQRLNSTNTSPSSWVAHFLPGSIPLEMLGNNTSREILQGGCPTGDRSQALATATQEWYGWANWSHNNGIQISGDVTTLAHYAGTQLGLDSDRINRILQTIDPISSLPAALYRGGEESCWKKIKRLDKATFERQCPAHIKAAIAETFQKQGNEEWAIGPSVAPLCSLLPVKSSPKPKSVETESGSGSCCGSGGGRSGSPSSASDDSDRNNHNNAGIVAKLQMSESQGVTTITKTIKDILLQDLPPSELQTAKIQIRRANPYVSPTEIQKLFETSEQELELSESRSDRAQEVDNLLKLGNQSLNLNKFLPPDLAEPLTQFSAQLNIRPEVCLTLLMVAASSLHKTQTELVIHKSSGFSVPPTIFAGLVSESGQKKSPLLKAIIKKPLSVLQREKREAHSTAVQEYESEITNWDKCKAEERSSKFPQGKPKLPQQRLYYFTNATGEGLLYQFQAHPDKALLALVDELVGLFASQNKYSGGRGSDRQDILSAFDGTGATVLRASGTRADIDGLLLSICGTIQPELLKRLMRDCSDPDGQWARFLFVNQPLAAATLNDDDGQGVDLQGRLLDYYRAIDRLPAREYRLGGEAFKRYQSVYNQLERLRVSHPTPGMRAVYSKMEGYIGRLALNLHVLHELSLGKSFPDEEIPLSTLDAAIALAKFYIGQVKLIHANARADLGEMAPHLVRLVELSKRMDATTGNSWIKAKVVQTGYDSRHRPRPDTVRSWFRELEALGIGSTRGSGIRLEYSWKLPDLEKDGSDPPPNKKVEKSGEKWITSPPTEPTQNQGVPKKVEKVDTPTHVLELEEQKLDCGVTDADIERRSCDEYALNQTYIIPNPEFGKGSSPTCLYSIDGIEEGSPQEADGFMEDSNGDSTPPLRERASFSPSQNLKQITHSTYPQSCCNDAIAPTEAVDTLSTFSPPVESVSTFTTAEEGRLSAIGEGDRVPEEELTPPPSPSSPSSPMQNTSVEPTQELVEEPRSFEELSSKGSESVVVVILGATSSGDNDGLRLTQTGIKTLPLLTLVMSAIARYCSSPVQEDAGTPEHGERESCEQGLQSPAKTQLTNSALSGGFKPLDGSCPDAGLKALFSLRVYASPYPHVFFAFEVG